MLRPIPNTCRYKGCDIPALDWEGDTADVEQAHWGQHRWLLKGSSPELYVSAASSYARAASATHAFYAEMGLTDEDAEHAIFTARMDADIGADEHETRGRRG